MAGGRRGTGSRPRRGPRAATTAAAPARVEPAPEEQASERRAREDTAPPRIGLWGTFDLENYGDMLFPRILEEELGRRLPGAQIRVFGPVGYTGLNRFEEREPAEPLGPWSPERVVELAEELDVVVVGPGEIIHTRDELLGPHYGLAPDEMRQRAPSRFFISGLGPELEAGCPVVWCAVGIPFDIRAGESRWFRDALAGRPVVSVRDEHSLRRLEAAGVDREIEVVPDPAFLIRRLFPPRLLEKRLAQLRTAGAYPEDAPIVVQGNAGSLPHVSALAAALERLRDEQGYGEVVLLETGPLHGDGEFAGALAQTLPGSVRLTTGGLADVAAAISASAGFIGTSMHGNITALAYDRPHLVLAWGRETKLEGFAAATDNPDCLVERADDVPTAFEKVSALGSRAEVVAGLERRADAHLDRIAAVAAEAARRRERPAPGSPPADTLEVLRRAYEARGRVLVAQRWALADRLADLDAEIARLKQEVGRLEQEVAGKARELQSLLNTKTFRYTASLRRLYGALRPRRR